MRRRLALAFVVPLLCAQVRVPRNRTTPAERRAVATNPAHPIVNLITCDLDRDADHGASPAFSVEGPRATVFVLRWGGCDGDFVNTMRAIDGLWMALASMGFTAVRCANPAYGTGAQWDLATQPPFEPTH